MSKKGRRGRAKKGQGRRAESAPVSLDATDALPPSDPAQTPAPEAPAEMPAPAPLLPETRGSAPEAELPAPAPTDEPAAPTAAINVRPPEAVEASWEPPVISSLTESLEPEREPDATPPPVGDLDARFFADTPTEAWLAHELERRDPRLLRKMAANVALRRARLARYVVGVVAVAVVLCLAALIKSAVPAADDAAVPGHGAGTPVPAAQPAALPLPRMAPGTPAASADRADGGG